MSKATFCLFATLALGASLGTPVATAQVATTEPTTEVYEAGQVNLTYSRVYIHVFKTGLGHEHGVVGMLKQGRIELAQDDGGGEFVFDMQSFDADTDEARRYVGLSGSTDASTRKQVNENMHGSSILDTRKFSTATFKIKSVRKLAQASRRNLPQYQLEGDFALHGVTHPIRIVADSEPKNGWLHLRGDFSIDQTSYGIEPFKKAFGAIGVADRLQIFGDLWIASERMEIEKTARR